MLSYNWAIFSSLRSLSNLASTLSFPNKKPLVVIGLSGGVDSAVAALLLLRAGHPVIGVYMENWDAEVNGEKMGRPAPTATGCSSAVDYADAQAVAKQLSIPLIHLNFVGKYWNEVFVPTINAYACGQTPNPDVLCNVAIKFGALRAWLNKNYPDAWYATGHYAKTMMGANGVELHLSKDTNKDQTYFLCALQQAQLQRVIFPLASLTKPQVRQIAKKHGLVVAHKKDSTGICFIGERDIKLFLRNYIDQQPGPIVLLPTKQQIGIHQGLAFYTLGQSRGLNLGGQPQQTFVVDKDQTTNTLYVAYATDAPTYLVRNFAYVDNVNWLIKINPNTLLPCQLRFRHRQQLLSGYVFKHSPQTAIVYVRNGASAITPGQYVAFYGASQLYGGGRIVRTANI